MREMVSLLEIDVKPPVAPARLARLHSLNALGVAGCPYMRGGPIDGPYTGPDLAKAHRLVAASHTSGETILLRGSEPSPTTRYLISVLRHLGYHARYVTVPPARLKDYAPGYQV